MSGSDLQAKVAVITGASSGIGQATAIMFARRGAKVTLCGRDKDRLQEVKGQCIEASGGHADRFITVPGDVTQVKTREVIVSSTVQAFGQMDVLVTNAGISLPHQAMSDATEEVYDTMCDVNLKSIFFLIQAALPHLERSKGNVVSTSSGASTVAVPQFLLYAMFKAALDHMTRCLALDLGPKGVRVNAVKPSLVPTRLGRYLSDDWETFREILVDSERKSQPMGECGSVDDVAEAICFLASDAAKFVTGECLFVDGGRSLVGPGPVNLEADK